MNRSQEEYLILPCHDASDSLQISSLLQIEVATSAKQGSFLAVGKPQCALMQLRMSFRELVDKLAWTQQQNTIMDAPITSRP